VTVDSPEDLAVQLTTQRLALCAAFRAGQYFWLNDSDALTGTQEFAVLKRLRSGRFIQLETASYGWGDLTGALQMILATLNGQFDHNAWRTHVTPVIDDVALPDNWTESRRLSSVVSDCASSTC
jgi:hypothetical protein